MISAMGGSAGPCAGSAVLLSVYAGGTIRPLNVRRP